MDDFALLLHRETTKDFIADRPSQVVLQRPTETRTASGGKTSTLQAVRSQTFRIIELGGASSNYTRANDGKQRLASYQLLGEWDADMKTEDEWTSSDGRKWKLEDVNRSNQYETRAFLTERGK